MGAERKERKDERLNGECVNTIGVVDPCIFSQLLVQDQKARGRRCGGVRLEQEV